KQISTTTNVMHFVSDWPVRPRQVQGYIQRGGTVAAAVLACFDGAVAQDRYLGEAGEEDHEDLHAETIDRLPRCKNDKEFVFVKRHWQRLESLGGNAADERGPAFGV
ncbi:MAG: hypothetical protein Q9168_007322, partial [Polycauliona sp. 1 TL-2023]